MSTKSTLRVVASGTAWSFLGVVLTIAFFYITQYRDQFDFRVYVKDDVNLVEVKERMQDLEIRYKGEDILNSGKEIRLLLVTLENEGETILQQHYDDISPFGLRLNDAVILDADIEDCNSEYLKNNILQPYAQITSGTVGKASPGELHLSKLIFEEGKFVTLKMYVLRPKGLGETPIEVLGKIANVDPLRLVRPPKQDEREGEPNPLVMLYLGIGYIGVLVVFMSLTTTVNVLERRGRKKRIAHFASSRRVLTEVEMYIMNTYGNIGDARFRELLHRVVQDGRVDFHDYVQREIRWARRSPFRLLRWFLSSFMLRKLDISLLPREIFDILGSSITLNKQNRDFIVEFFTAMGVLPGGASVKRNGESADVRETAP